MQLNMLAEPEASVGESEVAYWANPRGWLYHIHTWASWAPYTLTLLLSGAFLGSLIQGLEDQC